MTDRPAEHGFTLIEIMIVVAIIALISGIAMSSRIANAPQRNLNTGLRDVESALWEARYMAVSSSRPHWVAFENGTSPTDTPIRYRLFMDNGNNTFSESEELAPFGDDGAYATWQELHRSLFFNALATPAPILFNEKGTATTGGRVDLRVVADDESGEAYAKCLEVYGARIKMEEARRSPATACDPQTN